MERYRIGYVINKTIFKSRYIRIVVPKPPVFYVKKPENAIVILLQIAQLLRYLRIGN